eukprot:TRINITY_DN7139_c0_g1_i1.p1 TRINITY_DN7139_c0_g1~~TRINITY_DN7139_c0_g1_i1.p1  ORF type:complete len:165 (-),score=25.28 TRINITY_DN7139_c0_g1_i1:141-635(-)
MENLSSLPSNLIGMIASHLPIKSIFTFGLCNKKTSKIFSNELLWMLVAQREFTNNDNKKKEISWKEYVRINFFEWDIEIASEQCKDIASIIFSENNKKFQYGKGNGNSFTVVSKNIFKNGRYTINLTYHGECNSKINFFINKLRSHIYNRHIVIFISTFLKIII